MKIFNFKFLILNKKNGFTLVELIVVMSVFLLVVGVAVGIFISIVGQQKRILAEQEVLNETSYVMEYMSKAMRMAKRDDTGDCLGTDYKGYIYLLTRSDISSQSYMGIKFINASDNDSCEEFFLDKTNFCSDGINSCPILKELKNNDNDSDAVAITSEKLKINYIKFGMNGTSGCYGETTSCPQGASMNDNYQPRVTVSMGFQIFSDVTREIQTTVSQRTLNAR